MLDPNSFPKIVLSNIVQIVWQNQSLASASYWFLKPPSQNKLSFRFSVILREQSYSSQSNWNEKHFQKKQFSPKISYTLRKIHILVIVKAIMNKSSDANICSWHVCNYQKDFLLIWKRQLPWRSKLILNYSFRINYCKFLYFSLALDFYHFKEFHQTVGSSRFALLTTHSWGTHWGDGEFL